MKNRYLVVFSTCPDEDSAATVARALVSENLAACVNRVPGVRSTYRWQGELKEDAEVLLVIKTSGDRLVTLTTRIEQLHPYEVPEIIALEIENGSERYLDWLGQTLGRDITTRVPASTQEPR
jgi:periplasmic divalent cation tolerance protein